MTGILTNFQLAYIIILVIIIGILIIHFLAIKNILQENQKLKEQVYSIFDEVDDIHDDLENVQSDIRDIEKIIEDQNEKPDINKLKEML